MRYIRNEIQTPQKLVDDEKRKSPAFLLMSLSVIIFVIGATVFFAAFLVRDLLQVQFNLKYHDIQTYALFFAGTGMFLFIASGLILRVSLRKMNYYKLKTIIRNEPFDPPKKGDFTKSINLILKDMGDEWALYSEVVPATNDFKIPQVIVGPGGVFTFYPSNKNPDRNSFKDPGRSLEKASNALGNEINQQVIPFVLFQTSKLADIYRKKYNPKTRVMYVQEMYDYFNERRSKLKKEEQMKIEETIFSLIQGTPAGK